MFRGEAGGSADERGCFVKTFALQVSGRLTKTRTTENRPMRSVQVRFEVNRDMCRRPRTTMLQISLSPVQANNRPRPLTSLQAK